MERHHWQSINRSAAEKCSDNKAIKIIYALAVDAKHDAKHASVYTCVLATKRKY